MVQGCLDDGVQRMGTLLKKYPGGGDVFGCCADQSQIMHGFSLSLASKFAP